MNGKKKHLRTAAALLCGAAAIAALSYFAGSRAGGAVQESNPAVIPRVEAIQLLAGER